jgi:hypothetical protein
VLFFLYALAALFVDAVELEMFCENAEIARERSAYDSDAEWEAAFVTSVPQYLHGVKAMTFTVVPSWMDQKLVASGPIRWQIES